MVDATGKNGVDFTGQKIGGVDLGQRGSDSVWWISHVLDTGNMKNINATPLVVDPTMKNGGLPMAMEVPQNSCFCSGKNLLKWMMTRATPISGNLQMDQNST